VPRHPRKPPPVLLSSRVLEYAVLPKSTKFAGADLINGLEGAPVGTVPCLAIVESLKDGELILVYCDRDWSIRAFSSHESVARAKRRAERVYPGSRSHWTHRRVTVATAREHVANSWRGYECSFCGRTPAESDGGFIEGRNARICASCAAHAHEALAAGSPKAE
jgi:hypothetical protein